MKKLTKFLITVVLNVVFSANISAAPEDWQKIKRPIPSETGQAIPVGSYANGCIIGATPLPYEGEGYQLIRRNKNRYYGHPEIISYLQRLGKKVQQANLPTMLVGDISMPAGGRFLTGHTSHQMGLDVDIWFRMGKMSEKDAQNSDGKGLLVVNRKIQRVDEKVWTTDHAQLLKLAAEDDKVARIFVNPAIKLKLCETTKTDRAWLTKIRPWSGHDAHFHVRLTCPENAPYCENQAAVPSGDGCGEELQAWFKPAKASTQPSQPKALPPEPFLCQQIIDSPNRAEWLE